MQDDIKSLSHSKWRCNGFIENFNGKLRDECLNLNWFHDLQEAREIIGRWKDEYNTVRPHSALGQKTPSEYAQTF